MPITVDTDYKGIQRIETGLFSLDMAYADTVTGKLGVPLNTVFEFYGSPHIGKSTLAYYLAGKIQSEGTIILCDFEGFDIDYITRVLESNGFSGTFKTVSALTSKGKMSTHEDMMDKLVELVATDADAYCGIIDSIGGIEPIFQKETSIGEGMPAKRALIVGEMARKLVGSIREKNFLYDSPAVYFVINHAHSIVAGGHGHQSGGGVVLKHLSASRTFMYNSARDSIKKGDDTIVYVTVGKIEKLRYGGKGRTFKFATIPGHGVRPNLTAVIDCVDLGLATRGSVVRIGEESMGRVSGLVEADLSGNNEVFAPFHELLEEKRNEFKTPQLD